MSFKFIEYNDQGITFGSEEKHVNSDIKKLFQNCQNLRMYTSVTINDITYNEDLVIVMKIDSTGPTFGTTKNICVCQDKIYFVCIPYYLIGKDEHTHSYSVIPAKESDDRQVIAYDSLPTRVQSLLFKDKNDYLIVCRHSL